MGGPSTADARPQGSGAGACGSNLLVTLFSRPCQRGPPVFARGYGKRNMGGYTVGLTIVVSGLERQQTLGLT